jgi:hypothetical protein
MTKKQNYQIKTSPLALSRIKGILEKIEMLFIPEEEEDYGTFACAIISELSSDETKFNQLFQSITGTEKENTNFYEEEIDILERIAIDFFGKLGVNFKKLMLMKKKDSVKREEMVTNQMMEAMMPKLKEMLENQKDNIT